MTTRQERPPAKKGASINILHNRRGQRRTQDDQTPLMAPVDTETAQDAQRTYFTAMEWVPTPVYYWAGIGSILASLALHVARKKQTALFVGQWPPTFFILAVLYKQIQPSRES